MSDMRDNTRTWYNKGNLPDDNLSVFGTNLVNGIIKHTLLRH